LNDIEENLDLDFFIENLCQNDFAHKLAESINELNMKKSVTLNFSGDSSQISDPNETIKISASKPDSSNVDMQECTQISGVNLQLQNEIKAVSLDEQEINKINELETNLENYFNQNDDSVTIIFLFLFSFLFSIFDFFQRNFSLELMK